MTEIIAEIGVNHDGSIEKAFKLAEAAVRAGATVVKTQLSVPDKETSLFHAREHADMIAGVMLDRQEIRNLANYCQNELGVEFMCTPAEEESLDWLVTNRLVKRIKIASDAVTHLRFLMRVAKKELPVILSTGMADGDEVEDAFMALRRFLMKEDITLLHCTSCYPTEPAAANLRAIWALAELEVAIGWSDHTLSVTLPAVACGLGASIIEKHITLDRRDEGPDHAASLEPQQFAVMVANVREAEQALGDGIKRMHPCEEAVARVMRKSIVAARSIKRGEKFSWENLAVRRPGTGLSPARLKEFWGNKAERDYAEGEMI
jgi:sialic acid synthase SpsE